MPFNTASPLKILVIDDDQVDCRLLEKAFAGTGVEVELTFMHSGANALAYLTEQTNSRDGSRPDGCIFDINMPGISGIELLKRVKAHSELRKIPVLMLSSSHDRKDIAQCYELQASGYVCKPDNFETLKQMTCNLVNFWGRTLSFPHRIASPPPS